MGLASRRGAAAQRRLCATPRKRHTHPPVPTSPHPTHAADPEGAPFSTFYSDYLPRALALDAKRSSHALSMDAGARCLQSWMQGLEHALGAQPAALRHAHGWRWLDGAALPPLPGHKPPALQPC